MANKTPTASHDQNLSTDARRVDSVSALPSLGVALLRMITPVSTHSRMRLVRLHRCIVTYSASTATPEKGQHGRSMRLAVTSDASDHAKAVSGCYLALGTAQQVGGDPCDAARSMFMSSYRTNELYNLHVQGHGS